MVLKQGHLLASRSWCNRWVLDDSNYLNLNSCYIQSLFKTYLLSPQCQSACWISNLVFPKENHLVFEFWINWEVLGPGTSCCKLIGGEIMSVTLTTATSTTAAPLGHSAAEQCSLQSFNSIFNGSWRSCRVAPWQPSWIWGGHVVCTGLEAWPH